MKLSDLKPRVVRLLDVDEPVTPTHYRERNRAWYARNLEAARKAARDSYHRRKNAHSKALGSCTTSGKQEEVCSER